jgi:hypothetical protein
MPPADRTRRARRVVGLLAALASATLVAGCSGGDGAGPTPRSGVLRVLSGATAEAKAPTGSEPYAATAPVDELAPGQLKTVQVTVTNPALVAYRILELTATPGDPSTQCDGGEHLVVSDYDADEPGSPDYVVPQKSSITIPLTVMVLATAAHADACEDEAIPLTLSGAADVASAADSPATNAPPADAPTADAPSGDQAPAAPEVP